MTETLTLKQQIGDAVETAANEIHPEFFIRFDIENGGYGVSLVHENGGYEVMDCGSPQDDIIQAIKRSHEWKKEMDAALKRQVKT